MFSKEELIKRTTHLLLGASESIMLKANWDRPEEFGVSTFELGMMVDKRLRLACILPIPPGYGRYGERPKPDGPGRPWLRTMRTLESWVRDLRTHGWDVRLIEEAHMLVTSLIVDESAAICYEYLNQEPGPRLYTDQDTVSHYIDQFKNHWHAAISISQVEALYEPCIDDLPEETISSIALHSSRDWDALLHFLSINPEYLYTVSPRRFEEIVAELLERSGLQVKLTSQSRDGGRDILCFNNTPVGQYLYLVECKRHPSNRPVGVSIVRQLYGVVVQERATAGIVVTTSFFTKEALSFRETIKYQMSLKDFSDLKTWLLSCRF